jgi:hypothetical protein
MDGPMEEGRVSGDPAPKVKSHSLLFVAEFEGRRLSIMLSNTKGEMAVNVRGSPTTSCGMFMDKEIVFALTHWLQQRVNEM